MTRKKTVLAATVSAALIGGLLAAGRSSVSSAAVPLNCPPGVTDPLYCSPPQITATMLWTFLYGPKSTQVLSLVVNNATLDTLLIKCSGRGCPYARNSAVVTRTKACGRKRKRRCQTHGTLDLGGAFKKHHLSVGTKLSVAITQSGWIGKYYMFTVRAAQPPRVVITCLAPGRFTPTGSC